MKTRLLVLVAVLTGLFSVAALSYQLGYTHGLEDGDIIGQQKAKAHAKHDAPVCPVCPCPFYQRSASYVE